MGSARLIPDKLSLGYGESVPLRFDWKPARPLDKLHGKPTVFVHLLEKPGRVLRTFDHALPEMWSPGRNQSYEIDFFQSALGPPLPAGTYTLTFGLYDDSWGYRWPLETGGPDVGRREYRGAAVVVPGGSSVTPRFEFSGGWGPVQPGSDQQILGRRWLEGPGAIRVSEIPGSGRARLLINAATAGPAGIAVFNSCDHAKQTRIGPGDRWLSLGGRAGVCEFRFEAASFPEAASRGGERPLWLESLAWRSDLR